MPSKKSIMTQIDAFSAGEAFLMVNKRMLKAFGAVESLFLSNLIDKYRYFHTHNKTTDDGLFYHTNEDQMNELSIKSENKLRTIKRKFKELGIISTEMRGIPSKEYYKLNIEKIEEILESTALQKIEGLPPEKTREYINNKSYINNKDKSKDLSKRFSEKSVPKKSRRTRNNSEQKSMKQKIQEKAKLKSSVNNSVNKSVSCESTANIQLIEYWNSQDNLRTHKISADSKTYRNTLKKLQLLRTGQLHKNIDFKNAPINGTPVELFSKKFKKSEIAKAIKNLNDWCKEGNYPVKKDWIKRLSLADAIFCVQYGSPLLSAFHKGVQPVVNPVQKLKTDTEKKAYAKLEFFFAFRNGSSGTSLRTREQIVELIQSLKGLREQNAGNWNLYDPSMYGWGRSPNDVFSLVLDYIDFLKGENFKSDFEPNRNLSPIGLKIGGLAWKKFEKSYRDRFGVDVITGPAN